jgi:anaerobic magnesium-protoporphyrin IX monomethyl ester cyclase
MKIVLTHGYFICEDMIEQEIMMPYPPLGLLYLSAYLENKNIDHEVIDTTFLSEDDFVDQLRSIKPEILGFYANMLTKVKIIRLVEIIRSFPELKGIKIILGGPDVKYNIEKYLAHGADFLIIGEGEQTFYEYIEQYCGLQDYSQVNGLVYKDNNEEIIKNPPREFIEDIDNIAFPNREKIDIKAYLDTWKKHHGKSALNISTQRGCSYSCNWCSKAVYGTSYRRLSPKRTVDEIETIISQYNPDELWFVDDVFTANHKWVQLLCEELKKRNIFIPFECITRAERLNPEILELLKPVGCKRIWIGAESGSQKVLDLMNRETDIQNVTKTIQLVKNTGIEAGSFIMIGYPGETMKDIRQTIQFLKNANPDLFTVALTYPITGTTLFKQVSPGLLNQEQWCLQTDRQLVFRRTYRESFYKDAIRLVVNELNYYKEKKKGNIFSMKSLVYFLKAKISALKCSLKRVL